jgi:hypothetical protein
MPSRPGCWVGNKLLAAGLISWCEDFYKVGAESDCPAATKKQRNQGRLAQLQIRRRTQGRGGIHNVDLVKNSIRLQDIFWPPKSAAAIILFRSRKRSIKRSLDIIFSDKSCVEINSACSTRISRRRSMKRNRKNRDK